MTKKTPYLGKKGISDFLLHKSHIHSWTTCKRCGLYSLMEIEGDPSGQLITSAGTSFHDECYNFFDRVDIDVAKEKSEFENNLIYYFRKNLVMKPETEELLKRFSLFQKDRFYAFQNNTKKWFPSNREIKIKRPDLGLAGTIDSIEYIYDDDSEDKAVVEYKSGRMSNWRKSKLRRELAVYKLLVDGTDIVSKPIEHIGAFCAGNERYEDGIMFEKVNKRTITALFDVIKDIRKTLERAYIKEGTYDLDFFPIKSSNFCMMCQYSKMCYGDELNE